MGVENNECVLVTTSFGEVLKSIENFISTRDAQERSLFTKVEALINGKTTYFLAPDGSKKGWEMAEKIACLRDDFTDLLKGFTLPCDWVEVSYGEYGQRINRGNCTDRYR